MKGVLSLDLILTGIFILGMFGAGGVLVKAGIHKAEALLAQPACRMYAQELANAASLGTVSAVRRPTNVVSATVSGGKAIVEVNGITGTYSCEVNVP